MTLPLHEPRSSSRFAVEPIPSAARTSGRPGVLAGSDRQAQWPDWREVRPHPHEPSEAQLARVVVALEGNLDDRAHHGKEGNEFRIREARTWYAKALDLADLRDEGAVGTLVAMLLGMRASEIVSRRVSDLGEDEEPGDLLWIPDTKTPAGRRQLEVPEVLRPLLVALADGKNADRYLFEAEKPSAEHKNGRPHWRDWIRHNVHRVCELADVPVVTAHAMRGLLATLTTSRGMAGHLVAQTLGHENERTTMHAYAAPGSAAAGAQKRGLKLLKGGKGGTK